jgi:hypothetical protein
METQNIFKVSKRVLCMQLRYWLYLTLFFQYVLIVFLFGCVGTRRWVRKGQDETEWEGGLISVTGSSKRWKNDNYDDVKDKVCDLDGYDELCTVFKRLYDAGAAYLFFELMALIFVMVWIGFVVWMLFEKPVNRWWLGLLWPGISLLCHILAIAIWAGVTKAGFEVNCLAVHSTKICSTNGPALATLTAFLYLGFGMIFAFALYFRDGVVKSRKGDEAEEKVDDKA